MPDRTYGQFCGLARAAEVLGQRWTVLILRDLLVAPRRYSDLLAGLPGIPSNGLARRLKELEEDGLVVRRAGTSTERSVHYHATERARELIPALDALARWGAAGMRQPRPGEVVTEASLVSALRSAIQSMRRKTSRHTVYEVRIDHTAAHAIVARGAVEVKPGSHPAPDLTLLAGPRFRDVLAGELDPDAAVKQGLIRLRGDATLLADFMATFRVPYSTNVGPRDERHAESRSQLR